MSRFARLTKKSRENGCSEREQQQLAVNVRWDKLVPKSQRSKREQYIAELRKLDVNRRRSDQRGEISAGQSRSGKKYEEKASSIQTEKIRRRKKSVNSSQAGCGRLGAARAYSSAWRPG